MKVGFCSDTGKVRTINEDAVLIDEALGLFAVADGMGGHQSGEVASRLAVDSLRRIVAKRANEAGGAFATSDLPELLRSAFHEANQQVLQLARERASDMATTLTGALVVNDQLIVGHIGDSRVYRIRDKRIEQLTADHSLVAELVRRGTLTQEQAGRHPKRNVVLKAVGIDAEEFIPDIETVPLERSDKILFCSDGLTNVLSNDEIVDVVNKQGDPESGARGLVDLVNARGAPDNVTVVILEGPWGNGPPRRQRTPGVLKGIVLLAIPLLLATAGAVGFTRSFYYLGVADQHVAIFRGIPGAPAFMAPPSPVRITDVLITECLPPYRERLQRGILLRNLNDAVARIEQMRASKPAARLPNRTGAPSSSSAHQSPNAAGKRSQ